MKNLLGLIIAGIMLFACSKDSVDSESPEYGFSVDEAAATARKSCGGTSINWLEDILTKAEEDRTSKKHLGNYIGWISLTTFKEKPHFVVDMGMGSGGIALYLFDCNGNLIQPKSGEIFPDFQSVAKGKVIYSSLRN